LISCGQKNQDQNWTNKLTELITEPDKGTQIQPTISHKENESNTECSCDGLVD